MGKAGGKEPTPVIPAKAGIQSHRSRCTIPMGVGHRDENTGSCHKDGWIPAFAGMTGVGFRGNDELDSRPRFREDVLSAGMTGWASAGMTGLRGPPASGG